MKRDLGRKLGLFSLGAALALAAVLLLGERPRGVYERLPPERLLLYLHILGAALALPLGPFLLWPGSRRPSLKTLHRRLGTLYLAAVFAASAGSLAVVRVYEPGGLVSKLGLGAASLVWGVTAWRALGSARAGRFGAHRRFVRRNYALTLSFLAHGPVVAASTALVVRLGLPATWGYPLGDWLFWTLALLGAELVGRANGGSFSGRQRSAPGAGGRA